MTLAVVLALGAGLAYAVAAVLQQRAASRQPPELSLSPRLIVQLSKRPLWLAGIAFDIGAYVLEALALGAGSVVVVAPLMVSGLLFAIPLATAGTPQRVSRREMVPAALVAVGLACFVVVGEPRGDSSDAAAAGWVAAGVAVAVVAMTAVALGRRLSRTAHDRALLFGLGTGTLYGLTSVLTKATVELFDDGVFQTFTHWQPYALGVFSIAGLVLNQSAYQAGHVAASLPVIAVVNPVVASTLGVTLFGEHLEAQGGPAWVVTLGAIAAMVIGTVRLARSPLVLHEVEHVPALEV